jgi:ribosomal protein L14
VAKGHCDICREIERIGVLEASKRLKSEYADDVIRVLKGEPKPKLKKDESLEALLVESKKARDSLRWLFE